MVIRIVSAFLKAVLKEMDDDPREIMRELETIRENHLAHIYSRLGRVEGRMSVIAALLLMLMGSIWLPEIAKLF